MLPYSGEVSTTVGEMMAALALSEVFSPEQRRTLAVFCDTLIPSLAPPAGAGADGGAAGSDPTGFWARRASDMAIAEAIEIGVLQADLPAEQLDGLRGLLDSFAAEGLVAETPQEAREALIHGFSDSSPGGAGGRAHAARPRAQPLLRAARRGHRHQPELARDGLPGPAGAAEAAG